MARQIVKYIVVPESAEYEAVQYLNMLGVDVEQYEPIYGVTHMGESNLVILQFLPPDDYGDATETAIMLLYQVIDDLTVAQCMADGLKTTLHRQAPTGWAGLLPTIVVYCFVWLVTCYVKIASMTRVKKKVIRRFISK